MAESFSDSDTDTVKVTFGSAADWLADDHTLASLLPATGDDEC